MNKATIDDLAYLMKQAKDENLPKPIVFLGAGASKTGGVPLAKEIIDYILENHKNKPKIEALTEEHKTYASLMSFLTPFERNKLLKEYVDKAKINVTHIYLAQLIVHGYVDYVLTVNFDNLMLRALALFNEFPPTYDMAILKDLTTTSFKEKSVVYLHGQHHGLWLLNTKEEMAKVNELIPPILSSIKNQRAWIFIGYSGEDPIFEHITKLGRFDNGLFWVTYNESLPCDQVCKQLLDKANTNASFITGYDSDSFMLKLSAELKLAQPSIIDKPFSSLKATLENIVDIDDKDHFKGVKERLEIVKNDVGKAILQFEEGIISDQKLKEESDINILKKQIIDEIIQGNFDEKEISSLTSAAIALNNEEINSHISELYNNWGISLHENAKLKNDFAAYEKSLEIYKQATEFNPKNDMAFNNWANALSDLGLLKRDIDLLNESYAKYEIAAALDPVGDSVFYNWGTALYNQASEMNNEVFYEHAQEKFNIAITINLLDSSAFNNFGNLLHDLANKKKDEELFKQSFEKYEKALKLDPKYASCLNNFANALSNFAKLKKDETIFQQCFEKYKKVIELDPKFEKAYYGWGAALLCFSQFKNDKNILEQSFEKIMKSIELGGNTYNLSCYYAIKKDKKNALKWLESALSKKGITTTYIEADADWHSFLEDSDFIALLNKYKQDSIS